jgi:hypothetical protein
VGQLNIQANLTLPFWADYLPYLDQLGGEKITDCGSLNTLLPDGLKSKGGQAIRFVSSTELDDGAYEHRIYTTGQVSTRPDNWHDLFNALVWMRFPRIKVTMNSLHYHAVTHPSAGTRGPLRDALTLFDECGVIVLSNRVEMLKPLARRRWQDVFRSGTFHNDVQIAICGHAMLEKYLSPYKSMTAKALLIHVDANVMALSREEKLVFLDRVLAKQMKSRDILSSPACLAPLPLAGIPGWWPYEEQNDEFYADEQVFRPPPAKMTPAPVIHV